MKLLLVEDDREISEMLQNFLQTENFDVDTVFDGENACRSFEEIYYDLVILDLMLPGINGLEVIKRIRKQSIVPIFIISAKDKDADKILGLGLGADDYITKPFSPTEVLARVKANLRRTMQYAQTGPEVLPTLSTGELELNQENHTVKKNGAEIDLTAKEYAVLLLLLQNPQKIYTKAQLYEKVWQEDYLGDENAVNVLISRLRTKIEEDPRNPVNPVYVSTVWGIGYKLGKPKE